MELRPIKTDLDYQNALKEIEKLLSVSLQRQILNTIC